MHAKIYKTRPGLVACTTSGQEMERVYSYNPGARTGLWGSKNQPDASPGWISYMALNPDPSVLLRILLRTCGHTNDATSLVRPRVLTLQEWPWHWGKPPPGSADQRIDPMRYWMDDVKGTEPDCVCSPSLHLPPAHHSHPPSHIHCFIPGSKLTFSTNLFHHSLLVYPPGLPSRTILDRTYSAQRFFIFSSFFSFLFYFGSCDRLSWLNCQLSSAR